MLHKVLFTFTILRDILALAVSRLLDSLRAVIHYYTYRPTQSPKHVVVVGASYAGYFCAETLAKSLPSGWKVVLIEKNECFMHTWLFPRASIIKRHLGLAFVPYPTRPSWAPDGAFELKHSTVIEFKPYKQKIVFRDGEEVDFEYLVLATGLAGRYPAGVEDRPEKEATELFLKHQGDVENSHRIVVVGGGPVGVEVALDIKSECPDKQVTLVHSRDRLAHGYVAAVHEKCIRACDELGVKVIFNERVKSSDTEVKSVKLSTGEILEFDLLIMCTGFAKQDIQIPGLPRSLTTANGLINVKPTLQVDDAEMPNIIAIGDVAKTGVNKTGRAASLQGITAARNIVRAIAGKPMRTYRPGVIEHSLDLTMGLTRHLIHIQGAEDVLQFSPRTKDETVGARQVWKSMEATPMDR